MSQPHGWHPERVDNIPEVRLTESFSLALPWVKQRSTSRWRCPSNSNKRHREHQDSRTFMVLVYIPARLRDKNREVPMVCIDSQIGRQTPNMCSSGSSPGQSLADDPEFNYPKDKSTISSDSSHVKLVYEDLCTKSEVECRTVADPAWWHSGFDEIISFSDWRGWRWRSRIVALLSAIILCSERLLTGLFPKCIALP